MGSDMNIVPNPKIPILCKDEDDLLYEKSHHLIVRNYKKDAIISPSITSLTYLSRVLQELPLPSSFVMLLLSTIFYVIISSGIEIGENFTFKYLFENVYNELQLTKYQYKQITLIVEYSIWMTQAIVVNEY